LSEAKNTDLSLSSDATLVKKGRGQRFFAALKSDGKGDRTRVALIISGDAGS